MSIISSRWGLPRARNETAFEAHLARNIRGELRFRTSFGLWLGRPLSRPAPRVFGRSRASGRTASGVSGVWRHSRGLRTAIGLGSLGGAAARVVLRRSACSRAAAGVLGRKSLCTDAARQHNCASVFDECHGRLLKSQPRLERNSAFETLVPTLLKIVPSRHSQ